MIGLQDIAGARVKLNGILFEVVEISVGVNFDIIWPDPFAGTDHFFEAIYSSASGDTVGAKALYDLFIKQNNEGSAEELKNISQVLRHLSIQKTTNNEPYLHVDIGLAGDSFGTFGGIGSQAGGGTGYSMLSMLLDVDIVDPRPNDMLVYDSGSAAKPWKSKPVTLGMLGNVAANADNPPNNSVLIYDGTSYGWKPGTITFQGITSAELATGSTNGTMKLNIDGSLGADVPVKGLKTLAFEDYQYIGRTLARNFADNDVLLGITGVSYTSVGDSNNASYFFWDTQHNAWHFRGGIIADEFGTFGGVGSGSGAASGTLALLADVDLTNPYNGQVLMYDSASGGMWKNSDMTLGYLFNVSPTADNPSNNSVLMYDGASHKWKPGLVSFNGITYAELETGSTNGTLRLNIDGSQGADVPVKGLHEFAFAEHIYVARTPASTTAANALLLGINGVTNAGSASGGSSGDGSHFYWSSGDGAWHFKGSLIVDGFGSFGGQSTAGLTYTTLSEVWTSLTTNTGTYANSKIHTGHFPLGGGLTTLSNNIVINVGDGIQLANSAVAVNTTVVRTQYSGGVTIWLGTDVPDPAYRDAHTLYFEKYSSQSGN